MKKRLIVSLLVMFVMLFNMVTVCFAANENVTLTASKNEVKSGDTFEVIVAQESEGLTGFESTLSYDTNVFSVTQRELGAGWTDLGKDTKLDAMTSSAISSGNVFKLIFSVKDNVKPVTTEIKLTGIKAYRTSTDSVTIEDKAVSIKVIANESVEPVGPVLTGITLSDSSLNLVLGTTAKLNLTAYPTPTEVALPELVWKTSNESVAKIEKTDSNSSISVVSVAAGNTTITATTSDGKHSAKCEVTVKSNDNASGENNSNTNTTTNTTNTDNSVKNTTTNTNNTVTNTNVDNTIANKTNTTNKTNVITIATTNSTDNTTTSSATLPKTGKTTKYILLVVAGLVGISIVFYVEYRKYKEI